MIPSYFGGLSSAQWSAFFTLCADVRRELNTVCLESKKSMSQVRITDKRLIPRIKDILEQSVGKVVSENDVMDNILQKYPELLLILRIIE